MSWERSMFETFEDLEQQAAGLHLAERDLEVADLSVAEYGRVTLAARLHASIGDDVAVRLLGGRRLRGRLARVGEDWLLLVEGSTEWIVREAAVTSYAGLATRADSEETWSLVDRLSFRSVLRRVASEQGSALVHLVDDEQVEGRIVRVGRDFVELLVGDRSPASVHVVPLAAMAALQGRP